MADDFEIILAIQDLDTAADVLRHRLAALPERAELAARHDALAAIERDLAPTREARHQVERAQKALEDEIALLVDKRAVVEAQLYSSTSSNAKELQGIQDEIASFDRRRATLEDQILEQMVEAEPLDALIEKTAAKRAQLDEEAMGLTAALAEAESSIDAELAAVVGQRGPLADGVDAAILARYEMMRKRYGGVGVARLDGTKCMGCHLSLPNAEVEQVRKQAREQGVAECPECDRLLVV